MRDAAADVTPPIDSGAPPNSGDCKFDVDCKGIGGRCVALSYGGYRVCQFPVPPPTTCNGYEECCPNGPFCTVTGTTCLEAPVVPFCGGMVMVGNICASNKCSTAADCPGGVCVPAGALGYKISACMPAPCRLDKDCPSGLCVPFTPPCCSGGPATMACVAPGGCRTSADCPCAGTVCGTCVLDTVAGKTYCASNPPICPG